MAIENVNHNPAAVEMLHLFGEDETQSEQSDDGALDEEDADKFLYWVLTPTLGRQ